MKAQCRSVPKTATGMRRSSSNGGCQRGPGIRGGRMSTIAMKQRIAHVIAEMKSSSS
jgi:hypothetical protein